MSFFNLLLSIFVQLSYERFLSNYHSHINDNKMKKKKGLKLTC